MTNIVDTYELNASSNLPIVMEAVRKSLGSSETAMVSMVRVFENAKGKMTGASASIVDGTQKIDIAFRNTKKGFYEVGRTVTETAKSWETYSQAVVAAAYKEDRVWESKRAALRDYANYQNQLFDEMTAKQEEAARRMATQRQTGLDVTGTIRRDVGFANLPTTNQQVVNGYTTQLREITDRTGILKRDLVRIWNEVRGGIVKSYTGAHADVQQIMQRILKESEDVVSASARRIASINAQVQAANASRAVLGGFTTTSKYQNATTDEKIKLAQAAAALESYVQKNRIAAAEVERVWNQVRIGNIDPLTKDAGLQRQLYNVSTAMEACGTSANTAAKGVHTFTLSWETFIRAGLLSIFYRGMYGAINAMQQAADTAKDLSIRIAEVQTISQGAGVSTEQWQRALVGLSNSFGLDVLDQTEAAYQTISNQIAQGADAINFLTEANKFAVATNSSVADSVNLLSSAINAFNIPAIRAEEVAATLFKTIELGRVRASQLAENFGTVAVIANEVGVSFEELAAAIAQISISGVSPQQTMTQLRNLFIRLVKPTGDLQKLFRGLGVESGDQLFKIYGFSRGMEILADAAHGSTAEMADLLKNIRAIQGALGISRDLERYKDTLDEVTNSMQAYEKAVALAMDNSGRQVEIFRTRAQNAFLNVGQALNDMLVKFFGPAAIAISDYMNEESFLLEAQQQSWDAYRDGVLKSLDEQEKGVAEAFDGIERIFLKANAEINRSTNALLTASLETWSKYKDEFDNVLDELVAGQKKRVQELDKTISDADQNINKLTSELKKTAFIRNDTLFDWEAERTEGLATIQLYKNRLAELQTQGRKLFEAGDTEGGLARFRESFDLINRLRKLEDEGVAEQRKLDKQKEELAKKHEEALLGIRRAYIKKLNDTNKANDAQAALDRDRAIQKENESFAQSQKELFAELAKVSGITPSTFDEQGALDQYIRDYNAMIQEGIEQERKAREEAFEERKRQILQLQTLELAVNNIKKVDLQKISEIEDPEALTKAQERLIGYWEQLAVATAGITIPDDVRKVLDLEREAANVTLAQTRNRIERNAQLAKELELTQKVKAQHEADTAVFKEQLSTREALLAAESNLARFNIVGLENAATGYTESFLEGTNIPGQLRRAMKQLFDEIRSGTTLTPDLLKQVQEELDVQEVVLGEAFTRSKAEPFYNAVAADTVQRGLLERQAVLEQLNAFVELAPKISESFGAEERLKTFNEYFARLPESVRAAVGPYNENIDASAELKKNMEALVDPLQRADAIAKAGDIDAIPDIIGQIAASTTVISELSPAPIFEDIKTLGTDATAASEGVSKLVKTLNEIYPAGEGQRGPSNFIRLSDDLSSIQFIPGDTPPVVKAVKDVGEASNAAAGQVERLDRALRAMREESLKNGRYNIGIQTQPGQPLGITGWDERQGRANGGYINPSDTVAAMLTPGEYVINARSTARFYSQLVSMNRPRGFAQGGPVTNNNVGDINVSMSPSGNTSADVQTLVRAIQREIRRGRVSLT